MPKLSVQILTPAHILTRLVVVITQWYLEEYHCAIMIGKSNTLTSRD
jgi:hypothetical protein